LADHLKFRKIEVLLAYSQKLKAIVSSQIKTDKVNSLILAKLLKADMIPTAYLCSKPLREIKEVLRTRAFLVGLKTQIKNKIHILLHKYNIQENEHFSDLFGKKGRQFLNPLNLGEYSTAIFKIYLNTLDFLESQIEKTNIDLKEVFGRDETARFLEKLPGIRIYTVLTLLKEIVNINRFFSAKHLRSYVGLIPSTHQPGQKNKTWKNKSKKEKGGKQS